eukprot:gene18749-25277_t
MKAEAKLGPSYTMDPAMEAEASGFEGELGPALALSPAMKAGGFEATLALGSAKDTLPKINLLVLQDGLWDEAGMAEGLDLDSLTWTWGATARPPGIWERLLLPNVLSASLAYVVVVVVQLLEAWRDGS